MNWIEADTIPEECQRCNKDCYNCDIAGVRWTLSPKDTLLLKRKMLVRAMVRLQRKIEEIDRELGKFN